MKKSYLLIIAILSLVSAYGQTSTSEEAALNQVILEFGESIKNKDSLRFGKLFFHEKVPFTGIMSDATEMSIKKNYPDFEGISVSNSKNFIREICTTAKDQKENFYNIEIQADGVIASISFDYSFHSNNKLFQWGSEHWNLVYADDQWLITDVIYSIRFPDIEAFPLEIFNK